MNAIPMPRLPKHLAAFEVYLDMESFFGVVQEGTLPKFTVKTDDFHNSAGSAPVAIGLDFEAQSSDYTIAEPSAIILTRLNQRCMVEFRGSQFVSDQEETTFSITQSGLLKEADMGSVKSGDRSGATKFTHTVDWITVEANGKEIIHLDHINNIQRYNGVQLASNVARNRNIGRA